MKSNLLKIALISALTAIIVVVVLKYLGHGNPTVAGGAIAGGIAGGLVSAFWKKGK